MNLLYGFAGIIVGFAVLWFILRLLLVTLGLVWNLMWLSLGLGALCLIVLFVYSKLGRK